MRNNCIKMAIVILFVHFRIVASNNQSEGSPHNNSTVLLFEYVDDVLHQNALPYIEKVKYLIEQKADLNTKITYELTLHNDTLMSYSFKAFKELSMVKFMIEHNGNIHIKNSDGETPCNNLFICRRINNKPFTNDLLHYLESIGVDFLEKTSTGRPLLYYRAHDVINVKDSNYFLEKYLKENDNFRQILMPYASRKEGHQLDKSKEAMDVFLKKGFNPFIKFFYYALKDDGKWRYVVEFARNDVIRDVFFDAMMRYSIEKKYRLCQYNEQVMSFITSLKLFQKKHRLIIPKVLQQYIINIYTQDITRDEQSLKKDYIQSKDKTLSEEFIQRLDDHARDNNIITLTEEE